MQLSRARDLGNRADATRRTSTRSSSCLESTMVRTSFPIAPVGNFANPSLKLSRRASCPRLVTCLLVSWSQLRHTNVVSRLLQNKQCDVALNSALSSKALTSPPEKLSSDGKVLIKDLRNVIDQAKKLLLTKNEGELLQDFIWQAQHITAGDAKRPNLPVGKEDGKQDGNKTLEGLKTLGTLLITNGEFRKIRKFSCPTPIQAQCLTWPSERRNRASSRYRRRCLSEGRQPGPPLRGADRTDRLARRGEHMAREAQRQQG